MPESRLLNREVERPNKNISPDQLSVREANIKPALIDTLYYLNAGGLGTRLESVLPRDQKTGITKALVNCGGAPIVEYHLNRALSLNYGYTIIGAGHHRSIKEYIETKFNGEAKQQYDVDCRTVQYGTGGDLILALRERRPNQECVVIQNVDTLLDVSEELAVRQHLDLNAGATIILTKRKGVPNEGAFWCDFDNKVTYCREAAVDLRLQEPAWHAREGSSTGMVVVNTDLVINYPWTPDMGTLSLYSHMLGSWVRQGVVYGYDNSDKFFMDIGTPTNYQKMQRHPILKNILSNRVRKKVYE